MILNTAENLKERLNAPNLGTSLDARCGNLLEAATLYIAAYLKTDFTHGEVTDYFEARFYDSRSRARVVKFELSNTIVDPNAVVGMVGTSNYALRNDNGALLDPLDYTVIADTGTVHIPDWVSSNQVLEFVYTKGFLTTVDATTGKDLAADVPEWLAEAALMTAMYHYMLPNIETSDELCDGIPCDAKQLLGPYRRNAQNAFHAEA